MCMAFGNVNNTIKLFLYSLDVLKFLIFQKTSKIYYLTEVQIDVLTRNMTYNLKSQNPEKSKNFEDYFLDVFGPLF